MIDQCINCRTHDMGTLDYSGARHGIKKLVVMNSNTNNAQANLKQFLWACKVVLSERTESGIGPPRRDQPDKRPFRSEGVHAGNQMHFTIDVFVFVP